MNRSSHVALRSTIALVGVALVACGGETGGPIDLGDVAADTADISPFDTGSDAATDPGAGDSDRDSTDADPDSPDSSDADVEGDGADGDTSADAPDGADASDGADVLDGSDASDGGDTSDGGDAAEEVVDGTLVGPAGGTVDAGPVRVIVPAGALTVATAIDIAVAADQDIDDGITPATPVYLFSPSGLSFAVDARVEYDVDDPETASHVFWTDADGAFVALESDVDGSVVSAPISHFSRGFVGVFDADACADIVCDMPPAPSCEGDQRVEWDPVGVCDRGGCTYTRTLHECGEREACDAGACRRVPSPGDLVISELMPNPQGDDTDLEWIELRNISDVALDLRGLVVSDIDGAQRFSIPASVPVAAGAAVVLGETTTSTPTVAFAWNAESSAYTLSNTADSVTIAWGGVELDRVVYATASGWPVADGISIALDPAGLDAALNDDPTSWCRGRGAYGVGGNLGTPGEPNPPCDQCAGVVCDAPPATACADQVLVSYAAAGTCAAGICTYAPTTRDCWAEGGTCVDAACSVRPIGPGDLVITEFFANAVDADDNLEWFEVENVTADVLELRTLTVANAANTERFVVDVPLSIGPGARVVFGETVDSAPDAVDFGWNRVGASFTLGNTADQIILRWHGTDVDAVAYDNGAGWSVIEGASSSLDPAATSAEANDAPTAWCHGAATYGVGANLGTPGAANDACPPPDPCADVVCDSPPAPICEGIGAVITFTGGTCVDGACEYVPDRFDCGFFGACVDGACVGLDPCLGVVCETPPSPYCVGDIVRTPYGPGVCDVGLCSYADEATEDCSISAGACVAGSCQSPAIVLGELVITELMVNPAGTDAGYEWFEVYNASARALNLNGVTVSDDGTDAFAIGADVIVASHAHAVIGASVIAAPNVAFEWNAAGTFDLANTADELVIRLGSIELDRVDYDTAGGWAIPNGASLSLDPPLTTSSDNDDPASYCTGTGVYDGLGNRGTPGEPNLSCAATVALAPTPGDLVITEYMANPTDDTTGEWFEVVNAAGHTLDLLGLVIRDDDLDAFTVGLSTLVPAGGYVVFVKTPGAAGAASGAVEVNWGGAAGMALSNSADEIVLEYGGTEIDRVAYDDGAGWPDPTNAAVSFTGAFTADNSLAAAWCVSGGTFGASGDGGTPGAANVCAP
ncbi:MAG: lamin tail domain-containing protein [Myxococcales bacterium]|nr:lamin tail domain-containing protein [Myxococcales bacterium]MCB9531163.1 lamin tail domain-containing protein [Myxococcales bacterium]